VENPTITYGEALKAFRRNVYTFPEQWSAVVLCQGQPQLHCAMMEAFNILEASSLKVLGINKAANYISTERGGVVRFMRVEDAERQLQGVRVPHFIIPALEVPERTMEVVRMQNRHADIEDRYLRIDFVTL
jgi:hypothetical protein